MKKKIVALCLCVALAVVAIGGATLAYFTDTETKTNVFTVGNVDIDLTEDKWDADGANHKIVPTAVIDKDPTVTVKSTSERAYIFVKVQLSKDFIELMKAYAADPDVNLDLSKQEDLYTLIKNWFVTKQPTKVMAYNLTEGYVILGTLSPKNPNESVTYFDQITVPAEVDGDMIAKAGSDYQITITAYAIQAAGFEGTNTEADTTVDPDANKKLDREAAFAELFPTETIIH